MAGVVQNGQARLFHGGFQIMHRVKNALSQFGMAAGIGHTGMGPRRKAGGNGRGENKPRAGAADIIHNGHIPRNVSAHQTKGLGQRPLNNINVLGHAVPRRHPRPLRPIQAHGVDFVQIRHGVIVFGQLHNGGNGRKVPLHRIQRFKGNQLAAVLGLRL